MSQLSAYHLRRPRLTSRLLDASASVIVGGAGYGKSALAAESAESLDMPVIGTALESAGVSAALLPHRRSPCLPASPGKFAGASGPGAYQVLFGAYEPRFTSGKHKGECNGNAQPLAKGAVATFLAAGVLTVG